MSGSQRLFGQRLSPATEWRAQRATSRISGGYLTNGSGVEILIRKCRYRGRQSDLAVYVGAPTSLISIAVPLRELRDTAFGC